MKNTQLKKDWEEFRNKVLSLTHFIPETYIGVQFKNYEDHADMEGDYVESSITIYDNKSNLTEYWRGSYNLELVDYIDHKNRNNKNWFGKEYDCEDEYDIFFFFLYEIVAKASILLFKEMEIKND